MNRARLGESTLGKGATSTAAIPTEPELEEVKTFG
jgi:hypothetical protein